MDDETLLINGEYVRIDEMPREQLIEFIKVWRPMVEAHFKFHRNLRLAADEFKQYKQSKNTESGWDTLRKIASNPVRFLLR